MKNKMTETKVKGQNHVRDLGQDRKQALQIHRAVAHRVVAQDQKRALRILRVVAQDQKQALRTHRVVAHVPAEAEVDRRTVVQLGVGQVNAQFPCFFIWVS